MKLRAASLNIPGIVPLVDKEIIRVLRHQVTLVRFGRPTSGGKLVFFRRAVGMDNFQDFVSSVRNVLNCDMFSTLDEVESMERAIMRRDHLDLMVQCCIFLQFLEIVLDSDIRVSDIGDNPRWLFGSCDTLEGIAYLRSRLHFIENGIHGSHVSRALNLSLLHAVHDFSMFSTKRVTWQGLLLVFREAGSFHNRFFLTSLAEILWDSVDEMPKAAATLFLSFVCESIKMYAASVRSRSSITALDERIVLRLLELGASPMISRHHHHLLFRKLKAEIETGRYPWWSEPENLRPGPYPTALNRFLSFKWCPHIFKKIAPYVCCELDAHRTNKGHYSIAKVSSLQCLAYRQLSTSDSDVLQPHLRFLASKHRCIDLST